MRNSAKVFIRHIIWPETALYSHPRGNRAGLGSIQSVHALVPSVCDHGYTVEIRRIVYASLKKFIRLAAHTQLLPVLESGEETLVGGQAVLEGVMMRAPHSYCIAV